MERVIRITPEALSDALAGDVQEMEGDGIVAERVARVLRRDCARRMLLARLLPAIDPDAVTLLFGEVDGWEDPRMRAAAYEVLNAGCLGITPRPPARVRSGDAEGRSSGARARAPREGEGQQ